MARLFSSMMRPALLLLVALLACCLLPTLADSNSGVVDLSAAASSSDASALYTIEGSLKLPPRNGASPSAHPKFVGARVLLNGGESAAVVRADGSFRFGGVAPGRSYTLDVSMVDYDFPQVRVDVSNKPGQRGRMQAVQMPLKQRMPLPLIMRPVAKAEYFQKREPINMFGMLKNPMVSSRRLAAQRAQHTMVSIAHAPLACCAPPPRLPHVRESHRGCLFRSLT